MIPSPSFAVEILATKRTQQTSAKRPSFMSAAMTQAGSSDQLNNMRKLMKRRTFLSTVNFSKSSLLNAITKKSAKETRDNSASKTR